MPDTTRNSRSGGEGSWYRRRIALFPVGSPMDTIYAYGFNPGTLRERYHEGVDLILRA